MSSSSTQLGTAARSTAPASPEGSIPGSKGRGPAGPVMADRRPLSRRAGQAADAAPPDLRAAPTHQGQALTFGDLIDTYFAHKPCAHNQGILTKWRVWFQLEDLSAWEITAERLAAGAEYLRETKGYAISSVNRQLSLLGTIYKWAISTKKAPAGFKSPTLGAAGRKTEPVRYVEPPKVGEWERIRKLLLGFRDPKFRLFVQLVVDTGARRGEISDRSWNDFDLDAPEGPSVVLKHVDTKTGKPRRLYFSHDTAALFRRLRPGSDKYRSDLVFRSARGVAPNKYRKPWARLCQLIGRDDLHLHDLRHMVAAELLKAGKGMSQVSSLLGNSSLVLHRRYGHLDDSAVREIQTERLGLDNVPVEFAPVAEARQREAERAARAPQDAAAEAQRLAVLAQDAARAAAAAAEALAAAQAAMQTSKRAAPAQPVNLDAYQGTAA